MENVSNLALLIDRVLVFVIVAFVTTVVVSLGSGVLQRKPLPFWRMFGISCMLWLTLIAIDWSLD